MNRKSILLSSIVLLVGLPILLSAATSTKNDPPQSGIPVSPRMPSATDTSIRLVNAESNSPSLSLSTTLKSQYASNLAFSSDSETLIVLKKPEDLQLWQVAKGDLKTTLHSERYPLSWSVETVPGTSLFATLSGFPPNRLVVLWDAKSRQIVRALNNSVVKEPRWLSITFSPDGALMASSHSTEREGSTGPYRYTVKLWDVETGRVLRTIAQSQANDLEFSPDGKLLAGSSNHSVRLWNVDSGKLVRTFEHFNIADIAFSPDGTRLATLRQETNPIGGDARLWNVKTGELLHTMKQENVAPGSALFTPDSQTLAVGSIKYEGKTKSNHKVSGAISLYDVKTGKNEWQKVLPEGEVNILALSPDGKTLATNSYGASKEEGAIKLWKLK